MLRGAPTPQPAQAQALAQAHAQAQAQAQEQAQAQAQAQAQVRVVLFGENEGLFTLAAAAVNPNWRMMATEFASKDAPPGLDLGRHKWLAGIDAQRIDADGPVAEEMRNADIIIFNFPFVAHNKPKTVELINGFLQQVRFYCKPGAEIILGLATQKKGTPKVVYQYAPHSAEDIVARALFEHQRRDNKFVHLACEKVDYNYYKPYIKHGYEHGTTYGHAKQGVWHFNNRTAFRLRVQVSRDAEFVSYVTMMSSMMRSLEELVKSCPDRQQARLQACAGSLELPQLEGVSQSASLADLFKRFEMCQI